MAGKWKQNFKVKAGGSPRLKFSSSSIGQYRFKFFFMEGALTAEGWTDNLWRAESVA